jgi:hypothetical protein
MPYLLHEVLRSEILPFSIPPDYFNLNLLLNCYNNFLPL